MALRDRKLRTRLWKKNCGRETFGFVFTWRNCCFIPSTLVVLTNIQIFRFLIAPSHSLACSCANVTRSKGFTYFGLQFFGECWSGVKPGIGYNHDGDANGCVGSNPMLPCEPKHPVCVGRAKRNFVYKLVTATPTRNPSKLMLSVNSSQFKSWAPWDQYFNNISVFTINT